MKQLKIMTAPPMAAASFAARSERRRSLRMTVFHANAGTAPSLGRAIGETSLDEARRTA